MWTGGRSRVAILIGASIGLVACSTAAPTPPRTTVAAPPEANQPVSGQWQTLGPDQSTGGLRAYGGDAFPSAEWAVDGGALRTIAGPPVDLISTETYADFELEFEWRVGRAGNGGLIYRVAETAQPSWASGPEYQVLDDSGHPDGRRPETSAAALYDLIAPVGDKRLAAIGEYNTARIVIRKGRVEHWLNGDLVVAYAWGEAEIRGLIAASKFRDMPGFMAEDAGHIVLQHHGQEVWYRNIRIRRLGAA